MPSRGMRKTVKSGTHRMDGAIAALTPLGFSKKLIRKSIRDLIKVYGDSDAGWYFVEENYYKMVIDKLIEEQDGGEEEGDAKIEEDEATTSIEPCGQALVQLEAGSSSSNRELSSGVKCLQGRALIKMEEWSEVVPAGELTQLKPSSAPKRRPCYGWISEEED